MTQLRARAILATMGCFPAAIAAQTPREPGWTVTTHAAGLGGPDNGIIYDCARDGVLVPEYSLGQVSFHDGSSSSLFALVTDPDEMAVDWTRDRIAVKQHQNGPIHFFSVTGTPLGTLAVGSLPIAGVAFDGAGDFYVAPATAGDILRFPAAGLPPQAPLSPVVFATTDATEGIRFSPDGRLFTTLWTIGEVVEIVPPAGPHVQWASGLMTPLGLAFDPCSGDLFATSYRDGFILRIPSIGGSQVFADGLLGPNALDFDDAGNLYVTEFDGNRVSRFLAPGSCSSASIANAGPDRTVCEGERTTLDGTASSGCGPGLMRFRWLDGVTVVCPWSPVPTCDVFPTTATSFTLETECTAGCPRTATDAVLLSTRDCTVAVSFGSFSAQPVASGQAVEVSWVTLTEKDTLGFVVERASRPEGPWRALWPEVEAKGARATYRFRDAEPVARDRWYRVTELGGSGRGDHTPPFAIAEPTPGRGGRSRAHPR